MLFYHSNPDKESHNTYKLYTDIVEVVTLRVDTAAYLLKKMLR